MRKELTEIVCVVDRSGSMGAMRREAIGGFNAFLSAQKAEPGEAVLTLVLFDHEYELVHDAVPIAQVPPLDGETYEPRGTTALLDAVGRTIDDVGRRLAGTPEPQRPDKVIVAILTDGLENASQDYTHRKVAKMIAHQREKYSWEFVFLAANQDAIATAARMSIDAADAIGFAGTAEGVRDAYVCMSSEVSRRRRSSDGNKNGGKRGRK